MADLLENQKKENETNQSPYKIVPLLVLEAVSAFLLSFYFRQLLAGAPGAMLWFLVGLGFFVLFSFFSALFIDDFIWTSLAAGLATIAGFAVFSDHFSALLLGGGLVVFLVFLWGIYNLRLEVDSSMKINFFRFAKVFLSKAALGLSVMLTIFSYFLAPANNLPISFDNFQSFVLSPSEGLLRIFVPGFNSQSSIQSVLTSFVSKEMEASIPNFNNLPSSQKQAILELAVNQGGFLQNLEKSLGAKIDPKEPVNKFLYYLLNLKYNQLDPGTKSFIIGVIFVVLFLSLLTLFIPINWLLSFLLFLVYSLLLAVRFATIRMEPRSKEILVL